MFKCTILDSLTLLQRARLRLVLKSNRGVVMPALNCYLRQNYLSCGVKHWRGGCALSSCVGRVSSFWRRILALPTGVPTYTAVTAWWQIGQLSTQGRTKGTSEISDIVHLTFLNEIILSIKRIRVLQELSGNSAQMNCNPRAPLREMRSRQSLGACSSLISGGQGCLKQGSQGNPSLVRRKYRHIYLHSF